MLTLTVHSGVHSQPENLVPLCKFDIITYHYSFYVIVFTVNDYEKFA